MAARETHFELFLRKTPKSSWVLADAQPDRQSAIERAKILLKDFPGGGVRISKEERTSDGDYNSVVVTTLGNCDDAKGKNKWVDLPQHTASCVSASDLFSHEARKTYQRVMPRFLEKNRVLPGELVYRTDLLERLEASGSEMTQAIQRVAISRAGGSDELHAVARQLHELVRQAIDQSFKQKKSGAYLTFERSLAEVVRLARKKKSPTAALSSAISDRLMRETTWPSKLTALLEIWQQVRTLNEDDQDFCNTILSDYFSEWMDTPGSLSSMLGESDSLADMIDRMIAILEPRPPKSPKDDPLRDLPATQTLAEAISHDILPSARNRIVTQIFQELSSNKRLYPNDLLAEFKRLKNFGDRLVLVLKDSRRRQMYEAFCARSKVLMTNDGVESYLNSFDLVDRPLKLLQLAEFLVGSEARAKLVALFRGYISQNQYEVSVLGTKKPLITLSTLRSTQGLLLASELPEQDRLHGAQDIDQLGVRLIGQFSLIQAMSKRAGSPDRAALALLKLANEALPLGQCVRLAMTTATKLLKTEEAQGVLRHNPDLKITLRKLSQNAMQSTELNRMVTERAG